QVFFWVAFAVSRPRVGHRRPCDPHWVGCWRQKIGPEFASSPQPGSAARGLLGRRDQEMGERDLSDGPRIVVLIAGGALAHRLVNRLEEQFGSISVLKEDPESKLAIVRRRARLIGWRQALGQAAFGLLQKCVARRSAGRLAAIWGEHGLNPVPPRTGWQEIGSVNAPAAQAALRRLAPDVVVVYGTRIIKWRTLGSVAAPFINYHAGINPKYRGQNGAYWARRQGDPAHAGITVHLVDEGVDTGDVLYQATNQFSPA